MVLRRYKKKFMAYLNRDRYAHIQGSINPFDYHSLFHSMAKLCTVMDYEILPMWMYILPISAVLSASTASIIFSISIVEYVRTFNVHLMTECGTYLVIMAYELLMVYSIIKGKKHYHSLMKALREDFHYVCTTTPKYRNQFFENQRLTFKACVLVAIFISCMGGGMGVLASVAAVAVAVQNRDVERPLPFPYWLFDYNLHASPTYEILFAASLIFTFFHTFISTFYLVSLIIWVREVASKADIITWNLQDLLVDVHPAKNSGEKKHYAGLVKHQMREVIKMHHAMISLTESFGGLCKKCLLMEQKMSPPIICMTAFVFTEKYEAGEVQLILLVLCIAIIGVAFIPCYLCTHLLEKVQSVSDACWDMPFWNAGPVVRPYLVLIMQRSMRPLPIAAAGFADISLQTFASMITGAYSFFNMLRQADFNIS